ncbi:hypothetical protein NUSPORA_02781 [Nucleospora cyclopteri]
MRRPLSKKQRSKVIGNATFLMGRRVKYTPPKLIDTPHIKVGEMKRVIHENLGIKHSTFGALEHVRELNSWFLLVNSNVAAEKQLLNQCAVQPVFREEMLENFATIRIMWKKRVNQKTYHSSMQ